LHSASGVRRRCSLDPLGTRACPRQAWPVRLCNRPLGRRPLGRHWLMGACGAGCSLLHTSSSHFS
jgi:hypothetical protein